MLFLILQRYDFSSKSQLEVDGRDWTVVLFLILQRYDFSSKSQQATSGVCYTVRCFLYCKDTIFRANHNISCSLSSRCIVVSYIAKIRFFEQITTDGTRAHYKTLLFLILQRYDFSSKSQLWGKYQKALRCCFLYCKDTIF